ncbi:hypothetical protein [Homoserinibacter sp. YIM 151385]|uniref:hypothetical protein n=1 Tax=Homoserinibacter sp. YIM 151385 TaxID=2985506 RepID=UPI0022F14319|nr:hypothetical protein [Homoserinibacter sp. YIM 151385]WBU37149.1 hypothetical protein OF852_09460 [Homoserinibacter sp. YIM 151385]
MSGWQSPQLFDPLGGVAARTTAWTAAVCAFVIGAGMALATAQEIWAPAFEVAAFLALGLAGILFVRGASPFRFPFGRLRHAAVIGLLLAASVLDSVARWGANALVRDDWPPVAMAMIVLFTAVYRPAWEVLSAAAISVAATAAIALAELAAGSFDGPGAPPVVLVAVAVAPVAATGAAATAVAFGIVRQFSALRSRGDASRTAVAGLRSRIAPEVDAARSALLDAEVAPFLHRVAAAGQLTAEDSDHARRLASALRDTMSADSGRNWLEGLVGRIDDPERLAELMSSQQRLALRAFLGELRSTGVVAPSAIQARLRAQDDAVLATFTVPTLAVPRGRSLSWFAALLRRFFPGAELEQTPRELILEVVYRAE